MQKILVTEKISDKGMEVLEKDTTIQLDLRDKIARADLLNIIHEYDGMIVRSVTEVDEELYKHAKKLKVVGRAGIGVDNIDMDGATARGIIIVNTPEANIISTAEQTVSLLLSSARNTVAANNRLNDKKWDKKGLRGSELFEKTLGIIGLGRIGSLVATRLQAFGMKVIAYDPYITDSRFKKFHAEKVQTLDELLERADFITIHTPKTEETHNMIDEEQLAKTKKGVRIVNCARNGLFNENALLKGLESGHIASLGIAVLENEPNPTSKLIGAPHTVVTPHLGAETDEAQDRVGICIATEVLSALRGEFVPAVNLPMLQPQDISLMRNYLQLGEFLGKLYYQMEKDVAEKVEIVYSGLEEIEKGMLSRAVLKGFFAPILKERVNYVNALVTAENRGVSVTERESTSQHKFANLIRVNIVGKEGIFTVAGTVMEGQEIKIVDINGYSFDLAPSPFMLIAENQDKPGMIGQIGTLLGVAHVNIATMQVSRKTDSAMMFLTVDNDVNKPTLDMLRGVNGILQVSLVKF